MNGALEDDHEWIDHEDADCGCAVIHPRWCAWNGPCCDDCAHDGADHAECCGIVTSPAEPSDTDHTATTNNGGNQ